ncbi:MAG TPA: hypothetical protein VMB52_03630 [Verrucomicrobiae bacterium]|nr:hypothetical protein [Verrucomicrobiae bacterium]
MEPRLAHPGVILTISEALQVLDTLDAVDPRDGQEDMHARVSGRLAAYRRVSAVSEPLSDAANQQTPEPHIVRLNGPETEAVQCAMQDHETALLEDSEVEAAAIVNALMLELDVNYGISQLPATEL